MICFDVTKSGTARHYSGLMRVSARLREELGAALDVAVEPDHRAPARELRLDDGGLDFVDQEGRAHGEAFGIIARALDEEGALEPVRLADTPDRDELGVATRQSRAGNAFPRVRLRPG